MKYIDIFIENDSNSFLCQAKVANNFFTRLRGLLTRKNLEPEEGLWIVPCKSVHSFFMQFLFDVLFVSKDGEVLDWVESMPAWKVSPFVRKSYAALELPAGRIKQIGLQKGDRLRLVELEKTN